MFRYRKLALITRLYARLLARGMPLADCIERSLTLPVGANMKNALIKTAELIREGEDASTAFSTLPGFTDTICSWIEYGQRADRLAQVFEQMSRYFETKKHAAGRTLITLFYALCYVLALVVGFLIFQYASRQFEQMYIEMELELPALTQGIFMLFRHTWILVVLILVSVSTVVFLILFWYRIPGLSWLGLHFPLIGPTCKSEKFLEIIPGMSALICSGMPQHHALSLLASGERNRYCKMILNRLSFHLEEGVVLSEALYYERFFPRTFAWMISVGEFRNKLNRSFDSLWNIYERMHEKSLERLLLMFSITGIMGVGVFIGMVIMGLFLPLIRIIQYIG